MDVSKLREYGYWLDKSAQQILDEVKSVRGWARVFPDGVPLWAHRVRNFFNHEPISLMRYDADFGRGFLGNVQVGLKGFAEKLALSDYVYRDNFGHIWFQVSPGGTIYHWGRDPSRWQSDKALEAGVQRGRQAFIPIFKLVYLDGTGGSGETIVENTQDKPVKEMGLPRKAGRESIGEVDKFEPVADLILRIRDPIHQGSYNYSETVDAGYDAHVKRDVKPHAKYLWFYSRQKMYVNPPNRFMALASRRFPENDSDGNPLAKQV